MPDEAERQNPQLVKAIFEARNAQAAIDLVNGGEKEHEELAKHPELGDLLVEMKRAQAGE